MPIVDKLLSVTIKYLQKKQKVLKRKRKTKRKSSRRKIKRRRVTRKKKIVKKRVKSKTRKKSSTKKKRKAKKIFTQKKKRVVRKKIKKKVTKKKKKVRTAPKLKKAPPKKPVKGDAEPKEFLFGEITHYFSRIEVAVIKITKGTIKVGDQIHIKGSKTDFIQKIQSLQIESIDVQTAKKGQLVGLKIKKKAREKDQVFKLD